jgi:hypothetical protein
MQGFTPLNPEISLFSANRSTNRKKVSSAETLGKPMLIAKKNGRFAFK